uniref:Tyrosine specific protein phosphatases domain-containing protein n=1 Tax=Panagrolaimus sp. JU765 TaxID=591449 RepID=A0AC34Q668_9BILA
MTNVYSLLDIIKVMWFALKQGKIAVHCHAGLGRTCTLIACYLVWSKGITAEEAIKLVRTRRSKSIQSPKQILLVEQLATLMEKYAGVLPHEEGLTLTNYLMMQNDFIPSEETRKFSHIPKVIFYVCDRLLNLVFEGQFKYILSESEHSQHNVRECTFGKIVVEWKHAYTSKGRAQIRYMVNILARISAFPFEQDENTKSQFRSGITVVNIDKVVSTMDASRLVYLLNHYMESIKRPYGEKQHLISIFEKFALEEKSKKLQNNLEKSEPAKLNHTWQCLIFYLLNVLSYLTGENYEHKDSKNKNLGVTAVHLKKEPLNEKKCLLIAE